MYIKNTINYKNCRVLCVHLKEAPMTTPFLIDTLEDELFIKSLINSHLLDGKHIYALFFNQSSDVMLTEITMKNIDDFFMHVFFNYLSSDGYRYCYIPGIFPVTEIYIQYRDIIKSMLDWSIEVIDEFYDVPEYIDEFKCFLDANKLFRKSDKLKVILQGRIGILNKSISDRMLSVRLDEFTHSFLGDALGEYSEYLYSVNASLYKPKGFYFTYKINNSTQQLELWVSYPLVLSGE